MATRSIVSFTGMKYHDHYCYLPLYVYCGKAMLTSVLRRSIDEPSMPLG